MTIRSPLRLGLTAVFWAGLAAAQVTNMDVNSDLPYTFLPPGARSAGMGGAFTALADDATAAYSNPAGLLQLSRPEVSVEVRHQTFETPIADGPGSYGVAPDGSLASFPPYTDYGSDATGLSFLSYTWPKPRWAVGLFRTEVTRFSIEARTDQIDGPAEFREIAPFDIRADLAIEIWGAAFAWRATPKLWLGGAVTVQQLDYEAHQLDRRDADREWGQRASGDDAAPSGTLGVLVRPTDALRVGLAWRGGAKLDARYSFTCGTRQVGFGRPAICRNQGIPDGQPVPSLSGDTTFKVPDVWTLGVAFALSESLTASVQYDRIEYSDLLDGMRNSLTVDTDPAGYSIDDAGDLHFGVEGLTETRGGGTVAVRAGAWLEHQHSLRYRGSLAAGREELAVALFSTPIGDEWHATAGLGFTAGGRVQIDLAADLSHYRDTYLVSTVVRF